MQFCPIIQCNFAPLFNLEMEIHKEVVTSYYPKNIINRKFVQYVLTGIVWKIDVYVKIVIFHFCKPKTRLSCDICNFFLTKKSILTYILL